MPAQARNDLFDLISNVRALWEDTVGLWQRVQRDVVRDWNRVAGDGAALIEAVKQSVRDGGTLVQAVPRAVRIVKAAVRISTAYRMARARGVDNLSAIHEDAAMELRDLCEELGGAILKLGQFLSCRPDVLPAAYIEALAPLCHRAPEMPMRWVEEIIEDELGQPLEELFCTMDTVPLGTGSLAQVHGAVLRDGREVAVKVQIPDVDVVVHTDLAVLRVVPQVFSGLLPVETMGRMVSEFARALSLELDFETEAENAAQFSELYKASERIRIPGIIPELSTERVLTMELCHGTPMVVFLPQASAAERKVILELWLSTVLEQVLSMGAVHADPHAGNFLIADGDSLVILDFGCVAQLSDEVRRGYLRIVGAVMTGDREQLALALDAMGFVASGGSEALVDVTEELLAGLRDPARLAAIRTDPRGVVERLLERLRAAGDVDLPDHFVLVARVLGAVAGQIVEYGETVDVTGVAMAAVAQAMVSDGSSGQNL